MSTNTKLRANRVKTFYAKIKISKAVKKHPILYNTTLENYGEKDATLIAWETVADEMREPVFKCKRLWRRVLLHYSNCLKYKTSKIKSYFMTKHLKFLFPYLEPSERPVLSDNDLDEDDPSSCEEESVVREDKTAVYEDEDDEDERIWGFESRKQFLMSYLPDVRDMSYYQMSKFRQNVINLVDASLRDEI